MLKEIMLRVYNYFVARFFLLLRLFPLKNSVVCLTSFGDNIEYLIKEKKMRLYDEIIIFTERPYEFSTFNNVSVKQHSNFNLKELYEISRAKNIVMDNYFPVQGGMHGLKSYVNIIQTWHAVGAIKAFGLNDKTFNTRPECAKERFRNAYQNVNYYLSGSEKMSRIFKDSFGIDDKQIVKSGMPRIDFYYDDSKIQATKQCMLQKISTLKNKNVITYAPTYRDHQFNIKDIKLDLHQMTRELPDNYVIVLRLHPTVSFSGVELRKQVVNLSANYTLEEVLSITDILITDYSSVAYEFANLEKPIIFYPYDLVSYSTQRGLVCDYENLVTSTIAHSTDDIIQYIKNGNFDVKEIKRFKQVWNGYSNGNNTQILTRMLK